MVWRDTYDENDSMATLRWESDSPDNDIYDVHKSFSHPFRSTFNNTTGPDADYPGYLRQMISLTLEVTTMRMATRHPC